MGGMSTLQLRRVLQRRAVGDDVSAALKLALSYDFDPPRQRKKAVYWYTRAAVQGNAKAQTLLGECYRDGVGVRKNLKKAIEWLKLAAAQGDPNALVTIGVYRFYGIGLRKDRRLAVKLYRRAARRGNVQAQFNLGLCSLYGDGIKRDVNRAMRWFGQAAISDATAQYHLGRLHLEYSRPKSTYVARGLRWLERAACNGERRACAFFGIT